MIQGDGDALSASLANEFRSLANRAAIGRIAVCDAAARDVDRHPCLTECNCYTLSRAPTGPCYDCCHFYCPSLHAHADNPPDAISDIHSASQRCYPISGADALLPRTKKHSWLSRTRT